MKKYLLILLALICVIAIGLTVYLHTLHPSNDRGWAPAFSKLNTVTINKDGSYTIHNFRDFTYSTSSVATRNWREVTIRPEDIESVSFYLSLFAPKIPQIGHAFVSFRFTDGTTAAFSIEARREEGEQYTFRGGFLHAYELQYLWGTERDIVGQRVVYENQHIYRFPLELSKEQSQGLLRELVSETNTLAETPRFYDSLSANCTDLLAKIINKYNPGTLPYNIAWNLPGFSDSYLEGVGFIKTDGLTREQLRVKYDLLSHREEIARHASDTPKEFSDFIRSVVST